MKFVITYVDGWRWNITANNGKIIASGESYQRPQKMISTLHKYIVRGDPVLTESLNAELELWSLDPQGRQLRG